MSLHAAALAALSSWQAPDPGQEELRARFVDYLDGHADATTRECSPAHLTCGALVLDQTGEHVLMNLHGKARIWVAFGGHCEPEDDSLLAAATRELREESGLSGFTVDPEIAQLDVHPVDFCRPHGRVEHYDVRFVARAEAGAVHLASTESLDVRWFPWDAVPTREPSMLDLIRIARGRLIP